MLPLVLGQLILQFQKPIVHQSLVSLNATLNNTHLLPHPNQNRSSRSIPDYSQLVGRGNFDGLNEEGDKGYHHFKAFSDFQSGNYLNSNISL